jgi:hypothetical protein
MESLTLFDCENFIEFAPAFKKVWESKKNRGIVDVKDWIENNAHDGGRLMQMFNDCIIETTNNKDFFEWPEEHNGMYKFNSWCKSFMLSVDDVVGGSIVTYPNVEVIRENSEVDVISIPEPGYKFVRWAGDVEGVESTGVFDMEADTFVSAIFTLTSDDLVPEEPDDEEPDDDHNYNGHPDVGDIEDPVLRQPIVEEPAIDGESKSVQYFNYFRWGVRTWYGNDWYRADWFGEFWNDGVSPWVYHLNLGWLFRSGREFDSIWFWDSKLGWLWTSMDAYPYFFSTSRKDWILYKLDTKNPRLFYDFKSRTWEAH